MSRDDSLTSFREGDRLEAKSARKGLPRSLWETYSAFANTDGGTILLGVEERGDGSLYVAGISDPDALITALWDGLNKPSCVSANLLTDSCVQVCRRDERAYIAIEVPRAPRELRPVYIRGNLSSGTYRRNGEGDYHCGTDELKALMRDSSEDSDRLVLEDFDPAVLCQETIASYRNAFSFERPDHPWAQLPTQDFLLRLGAIGRGKKTRELHPTRAGLLMFGQEFEITREFPHYFLDYRTCLGDHRWDDRLTSTDGTWSGNVYDFWRKACTLVSEGLPRPFALGPDMRRLDDTPMHKALREALANALVHADYYGTRPTTILRERDKVTFSNPGGLLVGRDVALAGGTSETRNAALMRMFNLVGIGERAGSGFDGMRAACIWAEVPELELYEELNPDRTTLVIHTRPAEGPDTTNRAEKAGGGSKPGRASSREPGSAIMRILDMWEQQGHGQCVNVPPRSALSGHAGAIADSAPGHAAARPLEVRVSQHERRRRPQEERELIMRFVLENGDMRRVDVQELLGIGSTKAKGLLTDMVKQGLLIIEGAGPSIRYLSAGA